VDWYAQMASEEARPQERVPATASQKAPPMLQWLPSVKGAEVPPQ
jgi:hypothetical protein